MKFLEIKNEKTLKEIRNAFPGVEIINVDSLADFKKEIEQKTLQGKIKVLCNAYTVHKSADMKSKPLRYLKKGSSELVKSMNGKWLELAGGGYVYNNAKYIQYTGV